MIDEVWAARIADLVRAAPRLLGHQRVRADQRRGVHRLLRECGPPPEQELQDAGSPPRRRPPPGSSPHQVRSASSTGPTCRGGRGSGAWARSSASRPSCRGHGCGSGGSPPRSTGSTPSRAWSQVLRAGRRGPQGPAHRPHGGARSVPGPECHPPSAGGRLRPVPQHRDPGLPGQRRQAEGQGGTPLP